MPVRSSGQPVGRTPPQQVATSPCGNQRPAYDVAGRVNDLINCYLITLGKGLEIYLPQIVIAIILLVVMFLALRELLKG
jgi:hypothetical protein